LNQRRFAPSFPAVLPSPDRPTVLLFLEGVWPRPRLLVAAAFLLSFMAATSGLAAADLDGPPAENVPPALPAIPARVFKLTDFGALANPRTLNTAAFKKAIAAVEKAGGGKLVVPKGIFRTGPFNLCSNLELYLEAGAVIQGPETFEAAGLPNPASFKTQGEADAVSKLPDPLISGKGVHDVAITGTGAIDGSGAHWWAWSERAARDAAAEGRPSRVVLRRPHLVVFEDVQRLLIADVTLTNSPMFHLVPRRVTDLTIERVKVRAPLDDSAPNTNAIEAESVTRSWIHHGEFETAADKIVIKSGTRILIEDFSIKNGRGISIASETTAGASNILVRRGIFEGIENGIRISSMRGTGGLIENVRYTDITMKNLPNPIVLQLDAVDFTNAAGSPGDPTKIPTIRNITIDRVTIEGAQNAGIIHGLPDSLITGVTLRDVRIAGENDFDVKDADEPMLERVHTTLIAPTPR
jgi:polygalacturonase